MLIALVRLLIRLFPILSWDYRNRRIKRRAMCPACGCVKRHAMRFDPVQRLVVRTCAQCCASWGYNPIVNASTWAKPEEKN